MTKFSVLLSIYKKENPLFFKQSMDSLFTQTILPSEIVLIKDGPLTPELNTIISKYQSKHSTLKVISLPINQGLGNALNAYEDIGYKLPVFMQMHDIFPLTPYTNTHNEMMNSYNRTTYGDHASNYNNTFNTSQAAKDYRMGIYHEFLNVIDR